MIAVKNEKTRTNQPSNEWTIQKQKPWNKAKTKNNWRISRKLKKKKRMIVDGGKQSINGRFEAPVSANILKVFHQHLNWLHHPHLAFLPVVCPRRARPPAWHTTYHNFTLVGLCAKDVKDVKNCFFHAQRQTAMISFHHWLLLSLTYTRDYGDDFRYAWFFPLITIYDYCL